MVEVQTVEHDVLVIGAGGAGLSAAIKASSAGANVVAALRVAERLGPGKTVITLLCDSGLKYLSTDLYLANT